MPKVSVCSSIYNDLKFMRPMIASVVGQSFKDWELIIVDDGSDEDIKAEVDYWNDERIKYHRIEHAGIPHGMNLALSLAQGEYIGMLAADERYDLNKLIWQVGYMDEHPDVGAIWGLPKNGEMGERPEHEQYSLKAHNRSNAAWVRTLLNLESIPIGGGSMLMRKSVLEDIGNFDPAFIATSDLELFVRFFKKHKGLVFPYRWLWCEDNPNSITNTSKASDFWPELMKVRERNSYIYPASEGEVTVAIPVRNMAKFLPDSLKSLEGQKCRIMVVDDASEDDPYPVLSQYPDIQVFKFDENRGCTAAWNHMLAMCNTEFFVCLAADDIVDDDFIERCLAEFKNNPWLEFVASQTDYIKEDGTPHTEDHPMKNIIKASNKNRETWLAQLYYGNQYFGAGMYRTQTLKDVGGWSEAGVLSDYDMYLKLLQRDNIHVIEENLTHTRIHDGNRSLLKTLPERQKLRQDYHDIRAHYYAPRMKVVIATPFYEMRGFSPYISSMCQTIQTMTQMGIINEFWELSGDSYIDRAKNTLMNKFLEDPDATDLFMIDADMQWDTQAFINMLLLPEEIVMGSYPQKNMWEAWTAIPYLEEQPEGGHKPIGRLLDNGSALIKAAHLAGGFIRYKRSAIQKYKDEYKDLVYYDNGADPSNPDRLYTQFFNCQIDDLNGRPLRYGEDRMFGRRMAKIGIEGWIYPKLQVGHYGIKGWMGNFDTYLRQGAKAQ